MKISINVVSNAVLRGHSPVTRRFVRIAFEALLKEPEFCFLKKKKILEVGIRLAPTGAARIVNAKYRKKHYSPNVLSFPTFRTFTELRRNHAASLDLGDIILTPSIIQHEAKKSGNSFYAQFFWMVLHGILHLMGFDHERSKSEDIARARLEKKILRLVSNKY